MKEIEIRSLIDELQPYVERARAAGFAETPAHTQEDILFDTPDQALARKGEKLRLRLEHGTMELMFKGGYEGDESAARRMEVPVFLTNTTPAAVEALLKNIGFEVRYRMRKTRHEFRVHGLTLTFEEWPIAGCTMEIEGEEEQAKSLAAAFAPELSFGSPRLTDTLRAVEKRTGKSLRELKEAYFLETGYDLGNIDALLGEENRGA